MRNLLLVFCCTQPKLPPQGSLSWLFTSGHTSVNRNSLFPLFAFIAVDLVCWLILYTFSYWPVGSVEAGAAFFFGLASMSPMANTVPYKKSTPQYIFVEWRHENMNIYRREWGWSRKVTSVPSLRLKSWSTHSFFILTNDFVHDHCLMYFKTVLNLLWNAPLFHPLRSRCYSSPPPSCYCSFSIHDSQANPFLDFSSASSRWLISHCLWIMTREVAEPHRSLATLLLSAQLLEKEMQMVLSSTPS